MDDLPSLIDMLNLYGVDVFTSARRGDESVWDCNHRILVLSQLLGPVAQADLCRRALDEVTPPLSV